MVDALRQTYPNIQVDLINWKDLTITQQLDTLMGTTILITPAGGVSTLAPFLSEGADAIILDQLAGGTGPDSLVDGDLPRQTVSMEASTAGSRCPTKYR
ncbi:hypothetical protein HKX48_001251 [Thoreauomyces humboldtii]|nr:hypothetical protein HKX48_001251 [Thoreauomyces humboldtii]